MPGTIHLEGENGSSALLSECKLHRYVLRRCFVEVRPVKPLVVCMLNPSTADAMEDDPTIRRVCGFAKREGYDSIIVVNMYALRATDPKLLKRSSDPYGRHNDRIVAGIAARGHDVLMAWGSHGDWDRARWMLHTFSYAPCRIFVLGFTAQGHPKHPLYLRNDTPFIQVEYDQFGETATKPFKFVTSEI